MEYRPLGTSGLNVSVICLGTMTWGQQNTQEEAFAQMDYALEAGVNFFDAAELYPVPPKADTSGETERMIGNWFKERGCRDKVILASKVTGRSGIPWIRGGGSCLDGKNITEAVEGSLKRLQTDVIDLYQLHWPDRSTNFFGQLDYAHNPDDRSVPIGEQLDALQTLRKEGKIRHIGLSNETPWGVMRFLNEAASRDVPRVQSVQNPYNLLNRTFEVGLAEMAIKEQCGLLAYSPLAFGVLTGKYKEGNKPKGARLTLFGEQFKRYVQPRALRATDAYLDVADKHGIDPVQLALAFINQQPFVTSNIIGATTMEQLKRNIASSEVVLSQEVMDAIAAIHKDNPNPAP